MLGSDAKLSDFIILTFLKRKMLKLLETCSFIRDFLRYKKIGYVEKQKRTNDDLGSATEFNTFSVTLCLKTLERNQ